MKMIKTSRKLIFLLGFMFIGALGITQTINHAVIIVDSVFMEDFPLINWPQPTNVDSGSVATVAFTDCTRKFIYDGTDWNIFQAYHPVLESIQELRTTPGGVLSQVYVKSYWDGLGYGGGNFVYYETDITNRGDDGGISISAPNGGYWIRNIKEFRATYFGAVDSSDLVFIDKEHSTEEIDNLCQVIPSGNKLILDDGFIFKHYTSLSFSSFNLKEVHIEGTGSKLFRGNQIVTNVLSTNNNTYIVSDGSLFTVGMFVASTKGNDFSVSARVIHVDGNNVTVTGIIGPGGVQVNVAGGLLFTSSYQIGLLGENSSVRGVHLSGNRVNNQYHNIWNNSGGIYVAAKNAFVSDVTILECPGEAITCFNDNIIIDGFKIINCSGNGVHTGGTQDYMILNGFIKNVNILFRSGDNSLGHEGGAIAHSFNIHGGQISNIIINEAYAAIGDVNGSDDSDNHYDRIYARNCEYAVQFTQLGGGQTLKDLRITNSRFVDCGVLQISSNSGGPVDETEYIRDIIIDNVQLYNTLLNLTARSYNVTISNLYYEDNTSSLPNIRLCHNLKISNLIKIGGGRLRFSECYNVTVTNFEIRYTNDNSSIDMFYGGDVSCKNGVIIEDNVSSGFVGIKTGKGSIIEDVEIKISGVPKCAIEVTNGDGEIGAIIKETILITPINIPSILGPSTSSNNYFINNLVAQPISNSSNLNYESGTIQIN